MTKTLCVLIGALTVLLFTVFWDGEVSSPRIIPSDPSTVESDRFRAQQQIDQIDLQILKQEEALLTFQTSPARSFLWETLPDDDPFPGLRGSERIPIFRSFLKRLTDERDLFLDSGSNQKAIDQLSYRINVLRALTSNLSPAYEDDAFDELQKLHSEQDHRFEMQRQLMDLKLEKRRLEALRFESH